MRSLGGLDRFLTTPGKPAFAAARWGNGFGAGVAVGGGRYWAPREVTPSPADVRPRTKVCGHGGCCPSLLSVLAIRNNWRAHAGLWFHHGDTEDTERCAVFRQRHGRDGVLAVRKNTGAETAPLPGGVRRPMNGRGGPCPSHDGCLGGTASVRSAGFAGTEDCAPPMMFRREGRRPRRPQERRRRGLRPSRAAFAAQ